MSGPCVAREAVTPARKNSDRSPRLQPGEVHDPVLRGATAYLPALDIPWLGRLTPVVHNGPSRIHLLNGRRGATGRCMNVSQNRHPQE